MSERWIPVPRQIVAEAARVLSEAVDENYENVELPPALVAALSEFIGQDADCDHSVNICACDYAAIAYDLKLACDGLRVCPACGGDGIGWDQAKADEFIAENPGISDCFAGYIDCKLCGGPGALSITEDS